MKRYFRSVVDVRKGEIALTLLMFFYYYLLLVTYYFLKPARDSLFLVELGSDKLPLVFILIALIVAPVTTAYSRASRSLRLNQLINVTTLILIGSLFVLRWLLHFRDPWVFYTFYIWVSIYGALTTSQFWLLANGVFDATQAKRIFVLFGLGGIVGAFSGGEVTGFIVKAFGVSTENLLFFCMGFLGLCVLLVNAVWTIKQRGEARAPAPPLRRKPKESYGEIYRMIRRSRHLMLIVGLVGMIMATASFVDYQFKAVSVQAFSEKQALTAFLGKFYGRLSLISFLFQLLVSYRFIRFFGVGGAISVLPLGQVMGSIMMIASPGLLAGVLLRGADGVFKYSIDKTGRELLFLPVPIEVNKKVKIFIDLFVDRLFRGIAGAVLLFFVGVLHFSVRQVSLVVLVLLVIWLFMVFLVRREYVNAFRTALERREIDLKEIRMNIREASVLQTLKGSLGSPNERQIVYALEMLEGVQDAEIIGAVRPLLRHPSADVRRQAVRFLRSQRVEGLASEMERMLDDPDPRINRDALHYLCEQAQSPKETLERYLCHEDARIRSAAVACLAESGLADESGLLDDAVIEGLVNLEGPLGEFARLQVAESLGLMKRPSAAAFLRRLLNDPSPRVVDRALESIGRSGDREFVPLLLERLRHRRHRRVARDALSSFGERIAGTLSDHILDPSVDITIRTNLCRVLGDISTQHSVDTLIGMLDQVEPEVKFHVIKALNRLRARVPDLKFSHQALNEALIDETESYYNILQILKLDEGPQTAGAHLLRRALGERIAQNLERMFRLLGLTYSQKDIHSAYLGIIGDNRRLKASAVEFLDNVLRKQVKKYLFPIVDNITEDEKLERGRQLFGVEFRDRTAALKYLIRGGDPWLKACAIYNADSRSDDELKRMLEESLKDPYAFVRETAALALRRT